MTFKGRVKAGFLSMSPRICRKEPRSNLPLDPGHWLDDKDRASLHQALKDSDQDVKAGRLVDAEVVLRQLRSR
jgi:hypothetical protein